MLKNTLPLGLLVLALVTPCFMAPYWSAEDLATSDKDDDDFDMIAKAFNFHDYPLFNVRQPVEEPQSNLVITPNGIYFRSHFTFGPFENNNSDEDTKSPVDSDETQGYLSKTFSSNLSPFYSRRQFNVKSDLDNIFNDEKNKSEEDPALTQINESYIKDLINTLEAITKLNQLLGSFSSTEDETTNSNEDDTNSLDNQNVKNTGLINNVNTDGNGETNVKADSPSNSNVHIILRFDDDPLKTVDDKVENSIGKKTDDDIFKFDATNTAYDDSDEEDLLKTIDEKPENSIDNKDDGELLVVPKFVIPDKTIPKTLDDDDKSDENNLLDLLTTTKRTTEWDESDEIDDIELSLKKLIMNDLEKSVGEEVKFVPVLESNLDDMNNQPEYKIFA